MSEKRQPRLTRRSILGTGAAVLAANVLPRSALGAGPRFRRWEITDPAMPPRVLDSYKRGIRKMLELPPTDARNWYRNALVHPFDCPHGNWWFLVWHRAYLGWLEVTLRDLSGDQEFALPYWDWTKTPRVPAAMFVDVLDPNNSPYVATFDQFKTQFTPAIAALYASFTPDQNAAQAQRGFPGSTPDDFWGNAQQMFFDQPDARGLTASNPDLDPFTQTTVAISTIRAAIQTPTFAGGPGQAAGFQSAQAPNHSASSNKGILESQPHDNVHGAMGGPAGAAFMVSLMSSVDPIFFLHHGNLDRLWDVWTRRQTALGRPTLPQQGADLTAWSDEQFLFFNNAQGQPVTKTKAGEYASMSVFDYDYSPGSGEEFVPGPAVAAATTQAFTAQITTAAIGGALPAGGVVQVPASALKLPAVEAPPALVAEVTLNLGHKDEGRRFNVLVSRPGGGPQVSAGAITVFGHPHGGPTTFVVPLPESVRAAAAGAGGNVPLDVRVVPIARTAAVSPASSTAKVHAAQAAAALPLVAGITVRAN